MAGLPWFECDVDFSDDPKVLALASRLREPLAEAYVNRLYAYCYKHAQERFDAQVASDTVETAARWKGRRAVLFDALFQVGVLEREGDKVVVHGVKARLGPHLAKRVVDADRQRRHRAKVSESIGRPPFVTRDVTPDDTGESRSNRDRDKDKPVPEDRSVIPMPARRAGSGTKLGPLTVELRGRVERGIGHGLVSLGAQADADELEQLLTQFETVDVAESFIRRTWQKRNMDPQSLAWVLTILRPGALPGGAP